MKVQLSWIAIAFLTFQQTANAKTETCDENAPMLESGFYYELNDSQKVPDSQLKLLRHLAKNLHGAWTGEESVAICEGHFKDPTTVQYHYSVNAEISTSTKGALRLQAQKELSDKHISKQQTLWLTPETESLTERQRWHTLEFVGENTLIYSHKYRARNGRGTTRLIHEVNKLSVMGNDLQIDRKRYVNGAIVEQAGISLRKAG